MPPRGERLPTAGLVLAFTLVYSLIGLLRHWRFGSNAFDLGIFDQAIWLASRFEAPASTVSGFTNVLGDHFSPIVLLLAPLYWIAPRAETLIVAQAVLFAVSIVPVARFLRRRLNPTPALLVAAAYGMFWGLQRAAAFDVHEVAFAPLLIAILVVAIDERRWRLMWTAAVGIALIKEDLFPLLVFAGVYLGLRGEPRRGAVLAAGSVAAFVLVVQAIAPALSASGYQHAGSFAEAVRQPWRVPALLVTPPAKLYTALMWLAPFALLPVASPLSILLIAFALVRLLSSSAAHWGTSFHYSAPLAPVLAMSAADGLARIASRAPTESRRRRTQTMLAGSCLLLSLFLPGHQPFWKLFDPASYRAGEVHLAGRRAIAAVPRDASVVAQGMVVPHLSQRREIYVLGPGAPEADFVIACSRLNPYPNDSGEAIAALVEARRRRGYRVIFQQSDWVVLQR
jgi:uncharacterized membrane protein